MSIEAAKAFAEKIESDQELQAKVDQATSNGQEGSLAKVIEIGSDAGFEFSGEELREATSELGDKELDAAAGGIGRCWVKSWSTSGDAD